MTDGEWMRLPVREKVKHYPCAIDNCPRCIHLATYQTRGIQRKERQKTMTREEFEALKTSVHAGDTDILELWAKFAAQDEYLRACAAQLRTNATTLEAASEMLRNDVKRDYKGEVDILGYAGHLLSRADEAKTIANQIIGGNWVLGGGS